MPTALPDPQVSLLAFGAHPDDIEFGCGGVVAREIHDGRGVHLAICSRGEAATNGTPETRVAEAQNAADILKATLEWIELDGDARLERRAAHAEKLAAVIRRVKPLVVFAPSLVENQHPDHFRLGSLVRDATRLARFGGVHALRGLAPHRISALFFYAITAEAEPTDLQPMLIDVSSPQVLERWRAAMDAHTSQGATSPYAELQLARAKVWGLRAGTAYAQPLYPNDPLLFDSLAALRKSARVF